MAPGDRAMSDAATVALQGLGDEALEPLIELASDHSLLSPERDELAFIMLGRLHTPAARDWLLAASRNDHHKVRWNAPIGLGELGDRSVYPRLEEAARTDVDHSVRLAAISAMGGVKAPESYELLISLLGEQDAGLRVSLVAGRARRCARRARAAASCRRPAGARARGGRLGAAQAGVGARPRRAGPY